jgi:hypothetical protein
MTKSEDASGEGKALRQLQAAITFLEELQECQKRPTRNGNIDAQQLINGLLDPITEGLKELQIDLETKNDHSGNCSH